MHERILMAGAGGQGIMLIGKVFATAAMRHVPNLTFFPCYGAEVRGGSSYCQIILSSDEISSPLAETFDAMILMNQESTDRFLPKLRAGGLAVLNSTLAAAGPGPGLLALPATARAQQLGSTRMANFVALGALLGTLPVLPPASVEAVVRETFTGRDPALSEANIRALHAGLEAAGAAKG